MDKPRKPRTSAAAINRYKSKAYDRITLEVPKGDKQVLQDHAVARGESVNGFIRRAVAEAMERDSAGQED